MSSLTQPRPAGRRGFTLLELLVATVITLILTALVAEMFQFVTDGVFHSRANIELSDQLRNAKHRLIQDLRGATAPTVPPLDPSAEHGYFEYVEGGNVANTIGGDTGSVVTGTQRNTVIGDLDDILMFTTCSYDDQFVGKSLNTTLTSPTPGRAAKSRYAEVAWFIRLVSGQPFYNLHRRSWLVSSVALGGSDYTNADQSMRQELGMYEAEAAPTLGFVPPQVVRNSLGDLTMRERRSVHQPYDWPYNMFYTYGGSGAVITSWPATVTPTLSLPTLAEQTGGNFPNPLSETSVTSGGVRTWYQKGQSTAAPYKGKFLTPPGGNGSREPEDIILTNVVSFDIKAWDPGAPVFRAPLSTQATLTSNVVTDSNAVGLVVPGDGGYGTTLGALHRFITATSGTSTNPVGFGAYADLNYMYLNGQSTASNNNRRTQYLVALDKLEKAILPAASYQRQIKLPRPAFGFATPGNILSGNSTGTSGQYPAVYDTWSRHYEYDAIDNDGDGSVDEAMDGIDNNGNGYVDEPELERDALPPFEAPLRGIKIIIRVMEQDSRQVREVSTVHEFVPF